MEHPEKEIVGIVKGLVRAPDATAQRDVLQRYFTPDASFDHPLCASRDQFLLPIYQWLRVLYMDTLIEANARMYVEATQTLRWNLAPLRLICIPKATLITALDLVQGEDKKYYVSCQRDVYPLQEMPGSILPGLSCLIMTVKLLATLWIMLAMMIVQQFGIWRPKPLAA